MPIRFHLAAVEPALVSRVSGALGALGETAITDSLDAAVQGDDADLAVVPVGALRALTRAAGRAAELQRALDDQRDEFQFLTHDLASPCTLIMLNAEYAAENARGVPAAVTEALRMCVESAREVKLFRYNMLAVARMEHRPIGLARRPTELGVTVDAVVGALRRTVGIQRVSLRTDVPASVVIDADAGVFRRVLENLVSNALRFTPEGGVISIAAEQTEDDTLVAVRNTCEPIPPEVAQSLFERFSPRAATERGALGGLGLYFCRRAVEAHGGKIALVPRPRWAASLEITLPRTGT